MTWTELFIGLIIGGTGVCVVAVAIIEIATWLADRKNK